MIHSQEAWFTGTLFIGTLSSLATQESNHISATVFVLNIPSRKNSTNWPSWPKTRPIGRQNAEGCVVVTDNASGIAVGGKTGPVVYPHVISCEIFLVHMKGRAQGANVPAVRHENVSFAQLQASKNASAKQQNILRSL